PIRRPTAYATRGGPVSSGPPGRKVTETGPLRTRAPARLRAVNVLRSVIRQIRGRNGVSAQAESRWRPFNRRALMIARPARVDIRWRKPWFFARLRLFGWKVRFTAPTGYMTGRGGRPGAPRNPAAESAGPSDCQASTSVRFLPNGEESSRVRCGFRVVGSPGSRAGAVGGSGPSFPGVAERSF